MPLNVQPTQLLQFNVSYERQFATNWLISLAYIGNHTNHLWLGKETNPATYIPGQSTTSNTNTRRYLYLSNAAQGQYFADIPTTDDGATGNYNGLVVALNRRFADNWSLLSNVTWSKCINDGDPGIDITNSYPDPNDRSTNRGPCNSDADMFNGPHLGDSGIDSGLANMTRDWQSAPSSWKKRRVFHAVAAATARSPAQQPASDRRGRSVCPTRRQQLERRRPLTNTPGVWGRQPRHDRASTSTWTSPCRARFRCGGKLRPAERSTSSIVSAGDRSWTVA
jgi:hypothetical protein